MQALQKNPIFADVTSDQQEGGLESRLVIDRATAFRYGITPDKIDNTLYDAFGQRQVSTIYNPLNQYHVVMEIAPRYLQSPETLKMVYVSTSGGKARGSATTNAVAGTVAANGAANTNGTGSTAAAPTPRPPTARPRPPPSRAIPPATRPPTPSRRARAAPPRARRSRARRRP